MIVTKASSQSDELRCIGDRCTRVHKDANADWQIGNAGQANNDGDKPSLVNKEAPMIRSDVSLKRIAPVLSMMGAVMVGIVAFPAAPAHADDVNKLTCLTFSGPIELPSVALPAGSYLFKHP